MVRPGEVTLVEGGGWAVVLGDGCYDAALSDELRWIARRLYALTRPLAPQAVVQAVRTPTPPPPASPPHPAVPTTPTASPVRGGDDVPSSTPEHTGAGVVPPGGDVDDPRLSTATVADLAVDLVQFAHTVTCEADTVGFEREAVVFDDRRTAERALRLDRSRSASSADVVRCLSRALDRRLMRRLLWADQTHALVVRTIESLDADYVRVPSGEGLGLVRRTLAMDTVVSTWVFVRDRRVAARATIVPWHWEELVTGVLAHRTDTGVVLRWIPLALVGGVLEVTLGTEWPWWLDRGVRVVDDAPPPTDLPQLPCKRGRESSSPPSPAPVALSLDDLGKTERRVLERWDRSAKARSVRRCRLRRSVVVTEERWLGANGSMSAVRCRRDDVGTVRAVLKDNFPARFVDHVLSHAAADERIAVYHLYASDGTSLGAAMLVLFECTLANGEESVALMVDTFAVEVTQQGRGVGGRIFHDFCRRLADRHCPPRATSYYVFAQCVRKGDAGHFWYDKLDATSEARDVMLQAYHLGHVAVQSDAQCEAKGRLFVRDGAPSS